ncbi:MAG TPA: tRNA (N6-isopentenyl adenosine(37)-C2)-methylthiotransferase MiaB [Candidatus Polarisedimenticolaceae bacterium]|nr:tRNA (N6-isopentenyl adenosine(37)-C2)-methylthiotransferase MiaB [Candidatus Polarisedimenticolaceae bacterium]
MKKLYIQTYGCQMNQYDSERIAQVMGRANYMLTDEPANADLILLNTCSVRDKAEQKVYSALGSWREIKQQKSSVIIGVGGCVAQQEGDRLLKRVAHLDLVFGTHSIHKLPEMIEQVRSAQARPVETAFYRDPSYMEDPNGRTHVQGAKAFVTIMQGCNKVCSFCIVPHVRGREVSRASEKIIAEVKLLVAQGVKEVMLLGQNVNSYGKTSSAEIHFAELLHRINAIEGLSRIRFTTSHPQDLSAALIEAYATLDKVCEHLHLPVQSGSDSVLLRMRRGYTRSEYLHRIDFLRQRRPEVALSTDIIVGFPGETDADFERTLELLGQVEYDEIYSFMYSPRTQTVSAKLYNDDVPEEKKKGRLKQVQNVQQEISLRKNKQKIGRIEEVLVDGHSRNKAQVMGRTRTNRIVNLIGRGNLIGEMVDARIIAATVNSLVGELVVQETASEIQAQGETV